MADNVAITPGSGSTVRTDDVGGIQFQVVKLDFGGDGNSVLPSVSSGNKDTGTLRVVLATDQPALTNPLLATLTPAASGGLTIGGAAAGTATKLISAASTNATNVKASAAQLYGWAIFNINASPCYVKLYNKASAPTVGTDVPVIVLSVPGNAAGAGMIAAEFSNGIAFGTGLSLAITTGILDASTAAVAASEVIVNLFYK